jgi:hypothetical protein
VGHVANRVRLTAREACSVAYSEAMTNLVVEHHESPFSRRLRHRRARIAIGIAAVEAVLVLADVMPWWFAIVAAVASVGLYLGYGREHAVPGVRSATWVAAVSQLIVVLVPVAIVLVGLLALVGMLVLAAVALIVLLREAR